MPWNYPGMLANSPLRMFSIGARTLAFPRITSYGSRCRRAPTPRAYAAKILGTVIISNPIGYTFCRIRRERSSR
jgi:hypothetical protein